MQYSGNSIVDYLKSTGQAADYASRAQLAKQYGVQNYVGSAEQNTTLLNTLRGGAATPQPASNTANPQAAPTTQAQPNLTPVAQQTQPQSSGGLTADILKNKFGFNDPNVIQGILNDPGQVERYTREAGLGGGGTSGISSFGFNPAQPTINLPELYTSLQESSGVKGLEDTLAKQTQDFNAAVSKINNNPFLAEANRVGRIQKLQTDFNNATAGTRDQIATAKADIETQLNLQTKQLDINNAQTQQALDQFSLLLDSGALNSATGEDIASITRSTGLSSGLIQSAIQAKKEASYSTQVQTFDDGVDEGFVIYTVDQQGNIVNQTRQVTGKSSKGSGTYSTDPIVSAFIENQLKAQSQGSISSLYDEVASEGGQSSGPIFGPFQNEGQYGMSTVNGPVYYNF